MTTDMILTALFTGIFTLTAGILLGESLRAVIYPSQITDDSSDLKRNWTLILRVLYFVGLIVIAFFVTETRLLIGITGAGVAALLITAFGSATFMDRLREGRIQRIIGGGLLVLVGVGWFTIANATGSTVVGALGGGAVGLAGLAVMAASLQEYFSD